MRLFKIPAKFIRGGTSKGVYIESKFLPSNEIERDNILLKLMGSPDPTGIQVDGLGGGLTSTSKVALISKKIIDETRYLNYNFGQISIKERKIDWSGNCGNIASGLFEFINFQEDYQDCLEEANYSNGEIKISNRLRVWQENKKHKMFIWGNLKHKIEKNPNLYKKISISGVQGLSDPIFVEFDNITSSKHSNLFPTGNLIDLLSVQNEKIEATLISGTNPMIIIKPESLGLLGHELPKDVDYEKIKSKIYLIISEAARLMNIKISESLRVAWVCEPRDYIDSTNNIIPKDKINIISRITAGNRIHHAHTGTGAINLSIASTINGTIPNLCSKRNNKTNELTIGHPSGTLTCESEVNLCQESGKFKVKRAGFFRTTRIIMDGYVYY